MKRAVSLVLAGSGLFGVAGGGCAGGTGIPPGTRSVEDVSAAGLARTAIGKNKCNPKSAERPFIVEWDATDTSSFESRATSDVIFVKYEGCDLKVIDNCVNDSVKGAYGSYKPITWTSGSLESMDLNDEGELYAKLPLGVASLGGRIEGGEKFHMEYFVAGTRSATRDAIYRADLTTPSCKEATHFVYAYNLGAFALGSQSNIKGSVDGSVYGFGAGVARSKAAKADKQGGVLASCRAESAQELDTCKVPIRLTLREISEGESKDTQAALAAETPSALNLAGKLKASNDRERKAQSFAQSAQKKWQAGDGKGCVGDLDQHDQLDPRPENLSTSGAIAGMRGMCLMQSGQCATGKTVYRKWAEANLASQLDSDKIDKMVERTGAQYCQGGTMTPRDQYLKAYNDLQAGANIKKMDPGQCRSTLATLKRLAPIVKPEQDDDNMIKMSPRFMRTQVAGCLARAGDCPGAWDAWQKEPNLFMPPGMPAPTDTVARVQFDGATQNKCKGQ